MERAALGSQIEANRIAKAVTKPSILVCFAVNEEAAPFRKLAAGKPEVSILVTGMGRNNAKKSIGERCATNVPELVLTCGFAGALNPALPLGAILFETADQNLRSVLSAAGAKPAIFFCAARIVATAAGKKKLREETGADAVEMESESIHAVCRERGIPCATVRVISDTAADDLPLDFNDLVKPDSSMNYGKLAWAVVKSPAKIKALRHFQKRIQFAAAQLAGVLDKIT